MFNSNNSINFALANGKTTRKQHKDDSVAQLVERMTLNHWVVGSSPTGVTPNQVVSFWLTTFSLLVEQMTHRAYFWHWVVGSSPTGVTPNQVVSF